MKKIHLTLGYAGLIPFIGLSIMIVMGYSVANIALLSYACLIASFLGGTLWMSSVEHKLAGHVAVTSNLLMLAAWAILIFHQVEGIFYLASALFVVLICYERRYLKLQYYVDYLRLRTVLSWLAAGCLLIVAIYKHTAT
ncbi:MAG: DUF3429 domain-containing protein [Gammaproteobacteria bacterium]|nr:DUF3429 domain-containing protein [Gammaproteobacteria bacterium]NNJ72276.1 DUF3429 domain-containing protein [Enterobacterales bacterium]